jgi:hypothetical protein
MIAAIYGRKSTDRPTSRTGRTKRPEIRVIAEAESTPA